MVILVFSFKKNLFSFPFYLTDNSLVVEESMEIVAAA